MTENSYDASQIKVLEGLEAVRKRPAMYIGTTDKNGLHHLVWEAVDNSIDEALAGYCDEVRVVIHEDNAISVVDNGRGIPIGMHATKNLPAAEVVLTVLHAGGKFEGSGYKVSGGLHGVGISCVNALSDKLYIEIKREGKKYTQSFSKGIRDGDPEIIDFDYERSGTTVKFKPDSTIFDTLIYDFAILKQRLRELAYLNKGVKIVLIDERGDDEVEESYLYEGGLIEYVEHLDENKEPMLSKPVYINKEKDGVEVEVALQYNKDYYDELILTFANNIKTKEGGTHLSGFRSALTRSINSFAKKYKLFKQGESLSGNDVREGLTAVISVKLPDPQFEGQTKTKLGNGEIRGIVDSLVDEGFSNYLEKDPNGGKSIINKGLQALRVRQAVRKAQDLARRKTALESTTLPGKLADCSERDASKCEVYLVEGDSAGGSAKQGRDRAFQAILPLKGKILNVEKARLDKILANDEIKSMITAIGPEVISKLRSASKDEEDEEVLTEEQRVEAVLSKLRYHKIIIMTDADVDGAHIRTLLLTFFYRYAKEIIEAGSLYIAQPPLYLIKKGQKKIYSYNEEQKKDVIAELSLSSTVITTKDHKKQYQGKEILDILDNILDYESFLQLLFEHSYDTDAFKSSLKEIDIDKLMDIKLKIKTETINPIYSRPDVTPLFEMSEEIEDTGLEQNKKSKTEILSNFKDSNERTIAELVLDERVNNQELKKIIKMYGELNDRDNAPFLITEENKEDKVMNSLEELIEFINKQTSRGIGIQRYKGLGEMNPDQLWETTMDPATRSLLRVNLEDAEVADEIFSILMGNDVAPRRDFIQKYARNVRWIDV